MSTPVRVLILEDRAADAELMLYELRQAGFDPDWQRVETEADYLAALVANPDLILADWSLPQFSGRRALLLTRERGLDIPFIIVSGSIDEEAAVEAMRQGAADYLLKDRLARLGQAVHHALEDKQLHEERRRGEEALRASEQKLRSFVEQMEDAAVLTDERGAIIEWNRGAEHIFRQQRANVMGHFLWDVQFQAVPPERKTPQAYKQLKTSQLEALKAGQGNWLNRLLETKVQLSDGICLTVQTVAFPIQTKSGFMIGSISRDITERKRSEAILQQKIYLQEKMAALGRELVAKLDMKVIYTTVQRYLEEMIDCPNFGIALFDSKNQVLKADYFVADGVIIDPTTLPPLQYNPQQSSSGRSKAIASKTPVIVRDLAAKRKTSGGMLVGSQQEPQSAIYIPMLAEDEVIGLIDLQSYQKDAYSDEDGEWLSVVANQIGLAIQNARLFAQTRQRVAELLVLHNIDQAITTSKDPIDIYQKILEQILAQAYVDATDILIYNPQNQMLEYIVGRGFLTPLVKSTRLRFGEGLAGKAALEKHPVQIPNPSDEIPGFFYSSIWEKEGFTGYLGLPLILQQEVKGVLEIFSRQNIPAEPDWLEFMGSVAQQVAIALDNSQLLQNLVKSNKELVEAYDATITGWSKAMDLRDKETEGHTERVTEFTLRIAKALGLPEEKLVHVRRGALLHDIGKLGVPDHILNKPGPLTEDEWVIMKKHPVFAYEMLNAIDYLRPALEIPYCHHENWDGSGYPRGLKGQKIPLEARIFALVDVYDALSSDRPYRAAWTREKTMEYIQEQSGKQFDPDIAEAFLRLVMDQAE
jgi:PAS domain S-box-containing protein